MILSPTSVSRYRIRETLKTQMEDRRRIRDREWGESLNESVMVSQRDYRDRVEDAEKRKAKHHFLSAYTKANKEVIILLVIYLFPSSK